MSQNKDKGQPNVPKKLPKKLAVSLENFNNKKIPIYWGPEHGILPSEALFPYRDSALASDAIYGPTAQVEKPIDYVYVSGSIAGFEQEYTPPKKEAWNKERLLTLPRVVRLMHKTSTAITPGGLSSVQRWRDIGSELKLKYTEKNKNHNYFDSYWHSGHPLISAMPKYLRAPIDLTLTDFFGPKVCLIVVLAVDFDFGSEPEVTPDQILSFLYQEPFFTNLKAYYPKWAQYELHFYVDTGYAELALAEAYEYFLATGSNGPYITALYSKQRLDVWASVLPTECIANEQYGWKWGGSIGTGASASTFHTPIDTFFGYEESE